MGTLLTVLSWLGLALIVLVALIAIDGLVSRLFMDSTIWNDDGSLVRPTSLYGESEGFIGRVLVVYLPGILARPTDKPWFFYKALRQGLSGYAADALRLNYRGSAFRWKSIALDVVHHIDAYSRDYDKIIVVGESLGGRLSNSVYHEAKARGLGDKLARPLIIDAPFDRTSFAGGGDIAALLLRFLPIGFVVNRLNITDKLFTQSSGLPKAENIANGSDFAYFSQGAACTYLEYVEHCRAKAKAGLTGHKLSVWRDQLVSMATMPWYDDAFTDHPPLYIASSDEDSEWQEFTELVIDDGAATPLQRPENVTVKQLKTLRQWQNRIPSLRHQENVAVVRSTHCGYAERPVAWTHALTSMMARVLD